MCLAIRLGGGGSREKMRRRGVNVGGGGVEAGAHLRADAVDAHARRVGGHADTAHAAQHVPGGVVLLNSEHGERPRGAASRRVLLDGHRERKRPAVLGAFVGSQPR